MQYYMMNCQSYGFSRPRLQILIHRFLFAIKIERAYDRQRDDSGDKGCIILIIANPNSTKSDSIFEFNNHTEVVFR